ncbi:DUF5686 family protein [Mangrovibacterium marinum]|uniref:Carboxypeptidase-like protein n=1 Tax=Mangrovibacterium marinum TaxID=1639118 RepID=A0A2T5BY39_9BACT|nr:DUF5686 family protein [Mangrovibacterium marinum]PTN06748.1 carboxypeptidase-like protein [Mangrovibacterium marinum]
MLKQTTKSGYSFVLLLLFTSILVSQAYGQQKLLKGTVTDLETGQPIPFVNIVIKHSTTGTTTDTLGNFSLRFPTLTDTLYFTAIGYSPVSKLLPREDMLRIGVTLKPETFDISEVQVAPDEGPMRELFRHIMERKKANNPDQYNKYSYQKYSQWEYQITNLGDKILESKAFRKNPNVIKTAEDSTRFLPLYFSEQLVFNEIQKEPAKKKSTVLADRTNGVGILNELEISGYTSALDMEVNFYDNFINIFTQNFVSPLADNGWYYYKYFLADSSKVDGVMHYRVHFQPRRAGENTFKGYFISENKYYSIVEIDGELSSTSNLNFLKRLHLNSNYYFVNDSTPFYKRNQIDALFDYIPFKTPKKDTKRVSLYYTQNATIKDVVINPKDEIKLSAPKSKYETISLPDAYDRDSAYWAEHRMAQLTDKQIMFAQVVDSISNIRQINILNNLARMSMTSYYDLGKFEIGPFTSFYNTNKVEGSKVFMGARTSEEISKNLMVWGGLGYSTRIRKVSGMLGVGYRFKTINRQVVKLDYEDKMIRHGENEKILYLYENAFTATENNLVSQLLQHDPLDEIYREEKVRAQYEYEWYPGLSNKLTLAYTRHYSPEFYPFLRNGSPVGAVSATEINLDTRFSHEEKLIDKGFLRLYMGTEFPIIHLTLGAGQIYYNDQRSYYGRVASTIKQEVYMGMTRFDYAIEAGAYFGKLPYTMLDIPRGNETFGLYSYDFNLLNYLEYVHDKYLHAYLEYHLNGFFFRRVPLLKRANLREVLSAKALVGSLSDKHQEIISFPDPISQMGKPYIELGAGVENILSMFRIEALWRVQPQSVIDAPQFGIRARFEIGL